MTASPPSPLEVPAPRWERALVLLALLWVAAGHAWGLFLAPAEANMGQTGRILYLHVPTAWTAMACFAAAFAGAVAGLWTGGARWDALVEAAIEVGVVFAVLLVVQGSIWARPTWGVWWTWDPRLTTTAILVVAFAGILVLRGLLHRPEQRRTATAVATIAAFVDVPVVYFSVQWWRSLHQPLSRPDTVDFVMWGPLLVSVVGTLLVGAALVAARRRLALVRVAREQAPGHLPDRPEPLRLEDP